MVAPASLQSARLTLTTALPWRRRIFSYAMTGLAFGLAALAVLPLFAVLLAIVFQGAGNLSLEVLTALPAPIGMENTPNGFANAILGTLTMVGLAGLMSIPLGVVAAIFLVEYGGTSRFASVVRFGVTILSGVPSIVVGVFAYAVIVLTARHFSAYAGSFALAVLMLPIIVISAESALILVPQEQRLASAALGATRFQTIYRVVLRVAAPGLVTGLLLAISRAAGETAPLLFTALFSENWLRSLASPAPSMSVLIYNYAFSPYAEQNAMAWTAALVLLAFVLILSVVSRLILRLSSNP